MRHLGLALALGYVSVAGASPSITGNVTSPECVEAARLARSMFESTAPRLYAPLLIPANMRSTLVLGASELDISGGDALQATEAFEKIPLSTGRSIYWSKDSSAGGRIVVAEASLGWRGDMYSLYLLNGAVDKATFASKFESTGGEAPPGSLVSDSWRPPLVFQFPDEGRKWFIDVGQPYQIMSEWFVYGADGMEPSCTIAFRELSEGVEKHLPAAVRILANQLDEALGPGHNEGTLQPTARQRLAAQHVLANAAHRPWALSESAAYNSRSEVEAGLQEWAKGNRARIRLHRNILTTYPKAENSLATYYAHTFGLSSAKAREVAKWGLDVILRSYFVFPKGDHIWHEAVDTNPWPKEPAT